MPLIAGAAVIFLFLMSLVGYGIWWVVMKATGRPIYRGPVPSRARWGIGFIFGGRWR